MAAAKNPFRGSPGRPAAYTDKLAQAVLDKLAAGQALHQICALSSMPARSTVMMWVANDVNGFSDQYAQARNAGLDVMADDVLRIADGRVGTNPVAVAANRLRFDARRWYLSKMAPKRYGEKTTTEITGADGGAILIDDAARASRVAALLQRATVRKNDDDEPASGTD